MFPLEKSEKEMEAQVSQRAKTNVAFTNEALQRVAPGKGERCQYQLNEAH
jgi:hypothetical protein